MLYKYKGMISLPFYFFIHIFPLLQSYSVSNALYSLENTSDVQHIDTTASSSFATSSHPMYIHCFSCTQYVGRGRRRRWYAKTWQGDAGATYAVCHVPGKTCPVHTQKTFRPRSHLSYCTSTPSIYKSKHFKTLTSLFFNSISSTSTTTVQREHEKEEEGKCEN